MAENKKSFIAYCDWGDTFNELSNEEAGKLVKHLFSYVNDENPETEDKLIKLLFIPIQQTLKRDLNKYDKYIDKQRVNGAKGGRPKKPKKPKPFSGNPDEPKKADSVSVNVSVNDIITYLNLKNNSTYKATTQKTKELISARLKEGFTIDDFKKVIDTKISEWGKDPKMNMYLRPETLFSNKFEGYLNQKTSGSKYDGKTVGQLLNMQ